VRYFQAFHFFSMQVRCIEIVLPSQQMSALYFIRPMSTWYFQHSAKQAVIASIDLSTQDAKISEFVENSTGHFLQMEHTQHLTEWTFLPKCFCGLLKHPFRFFISSNGAKLVLLNRIKLLMNFLLCLVLILFVGEPMDEQVQWIPTSRLLREVPGRTLLASLDDDSGNMPTITYTNDVAEPLVTVLKVIHCVFAFIVVFVRLVLYVPVLFAKEKEGMMQLRKESTNRYSAAYGYLGVLALILALALSIFLSISGSAVQGYDPRYTFLIFWPVVVLTKKWFVFLGSDGPTTISSCVVGTLSGILGNESLLSTGACTYLSTVAMITNNPFWYAVTLLEIIFLSSDLRTIVNAVYLPFRGLLQVFFLMLIVFCIFAFYLFMAYSEFFQEGECDGLLSCFFFTIYRGGWWHTIAESFAAKSATTPSRLLSSEMSNISVSRGLFDISFFVLISILFFSMVAGLVIDTFGAMRDTKMRRQGELANYDFISGLPIADIKKAARRLGIPKGTEEHCNNRQHLWDYSSFVYYLQNKKENDLAGAESYVKNLVERKDNRWIPSGRCMMIERAEIVDRAENEDGEVWDKLEKKIIQTVEKSNDRLAKLIREQVAARAALEEAEEA